MRLHLDGATTSFCIPRGLSGLDKEPHGTQRVAIDTNPHPVSYSLFEGGGKHCVTGVWDIGTYVVRRFPPSPRHTISTETTLRRSERLAQQLNEESTPTTIPLRTRPTNIKRIGLPRSTSMLASSTSCLDMANRPFKQIRIEDTSALSSSSCRALDSKDCD